MKEITKHRLKQVNRLLKIGLLTFAWLMACIGVTAYSVYWLKQNIDYNSIVERDNSSSLVKKTRLLRTPRSDGDLSIWSFKDHSVFETKIAPDNSYYRQYFTFEYSTNPSGTDYTTYYYSYFSGDFSAYFVNSTTEFSYIRFTFTYQHNFNRLVLLTILAYDSNLSNPITLFSYDTANDTYYYRNNLYISFSTISRYSPGRISDTITNGVFYCYFQSVYDFNENSVTYYDLDFTNPYLNFEQLLSYSRVGLYDFIVVGSPFGSVYEIPFVFRYDGVIYESILITDTYIVQYINDAQEKVYYRDITGDITKYLMSCTGVYFKRLGGTFTTDTSSPVGASTLVGNVLQVAYREIAYFELSRLGTESGNMTLYPVWNMTKGYNTYGINSYSLEILNDTLDDIPFPNNVVNSAHYPLENLTIKEILSYISSYNADGFDNYGVDNKLGLGGVFTLIKGAFGGLTGLLAIQILPGLSLGLLLFVPLILTIIIVILRLVKK